MDNGAPPPPPPPPHGNSSSNNNNKSGTNSKSSTLPPGNYDIFVIPPHSSGSGFLYLPSLQTHRNSFLAGAVCTLAVVGVWVVVMPVLKQWLSTVFASGGMGMLFLIIGVGVLGWAYGKTEMEGTGAGSGRSNPKDGAGQQQHQHQAPPGGFNYGSSSYASGTAGAGAKPSWQKSGAASAGSDAWNKAREETRKKQEEQRKKDEDAKKAKTASDLLKAAREREARERAERMRKEKEAKEKAPSPQKEKPSASPKYQKPTAQSLHGDEDAYSYRPYDTPPKKPSKHASQSSMYSDTSWTGTHSTAKTTPPPSHRGPYVNKDPDKITIKAVYKFNNLFPKPVAQLVSGAGTVTDGLILRMTTEGLFIDDDVRGVGQREWDVKAWTMKLVEVWCPSFAAQSAPVQPARYVRKQLNERFFGHEGFNKAPLTPEEIDAVLGDLGRTCKSHVSSDSNSTRSSKSGDFKGKHVLRATIRDEAQSKYVFIIDEAEAWKVAVGLQRLRRSPLVRSMGASGMAANETRNMLSSLGWA